MDALEAVAMLDGTTLKEYAAAMPPINVGPSYWADKKRFLSSVVADAQSFHDELLDIHRQSLDGMAGKLHNLGQYWTPDRQEHFGKLMAFLGYSDIYTAMKPFLDKSLVRTNHIPVLDQHPQTRTVYAFLIGSENLVCVDNPFTRMAELLAASIEDITEDYDLDVKK